MTDVKGRRPEDHKPKKPKKEKPQIEDVDGGRKVTLRGVTVTVLDDALDDFELLEDLDAVQRGGKKAAGRLPVVFRRLVGDDEYKIVLDQLRGKNGRVSVPVAVEFIQGLFEAINPNS